MGFRPPYSEDPNHPDNWASPPCDGVVRASIRFREGATKTQCEAILRDLTEQLEHGNHPLDSCQGVEIEDCLVYGDESSPEVAGGAL